MAKRTLIGVVIGLLLLGAALTPARGDDFGKLLEKAAKKQVNQKLASAPAPAAASRAETIPFKTADGWTLVVHHYRPTVVPKPAAMPVILCHGLTYNAAFWDLDPACSFAGYLASHGYDVWSVDLRGSGQSQKWVWKAGEAPEAIVGETLRRLTKGKNAASEYATIDPKFANWSLDHHVSYDVPAIVKFVRKQTGAAEVAWVGHSMGGIVAICHLARYGNPGIGRLATIGSQVTMPNGQLPLKFLGEIANTRRRQLTGDLHGEALTTATKTSVHNMFFNVDNADPKVFDALSGPATDVPGLALMAQYNVLGQRGELHDARNQLSYAKLLPNIKVPMFISCGAADNFAPPVVQKYLFDHVGSTDKTLVIFGRSGGFSVDCGHDDTLVGKTSRAEVYPVIEKWLAR